MGKAIDRLNRAETAGIIAAIRGYLQITRKRSRTVKGRRLKGRGTPARAGGDLNRKGKVK